MHKVAHTIEVFPGSIIGKQYFRLEVQLLVGSSTATSIFIWWSSSLLELALHLLLTHRGKEGRVDLHWTFSSPSSSKHPVIILLSQWQYLWWNAVEGNEENAKQGNWEARKAIRPAMEGKIKVQPWRDDEYMTWPVNNTRKPTPRLCTARQG